MDSQKNKIFMIFSNKKKKLGFTTKWIIWFQQRSCFDYGWNTKTFFKLQKIQNLKKIDEIDLLEIMKAAQSQRVQNNIDFFLSHIFF